MNNKLWLVEAKTLQPVWAESKEEVKEAAKGGDA